MTKVPLTQKASRDYLARCKQDSQLKQNAVKECRSNFKEFLENNFELTKCQRDAIEKFPDGYFQEQGSLIAVALENDYELTVEFKGTGPEDGILMGVSGSAGSSAGWNQQQGAWVKQEVSVSWEKKKK